MDYQTTKRLALRRALAANAAFSAVSGLTLLIFNANLAALIIDASSIWPWFEPRVLLMVVGAGLMLFAVLLAVLARQAIPPSVWVRQVIVADIGWAVASAVLVLAAPGALTGAGIAAVVAVAVVVAGLAGLQWQRLGSA